MFEPNSPSPLFWKYVGTPFNAWYCRDEALKYYHQMVTIRRMETAAANLYKEKEIRGNDQSLFYSAVSWVGTYERESWTSYDWFN